MTIKTFIQSGQEARESLRTGSSIVAKAVGSTLGPSGKNVGIAYSNEYGIYGRISMHDGVTVARSIDLPDEFINFGAQVTKEAARKTVDAVGDGTTVATILSDAIFQEIEKLAAAGHDPMLLRRGIEKASKQLIEEIEKIAIPVKTLEQKEHVATVSAADEELGKMVAGVVEKMGEEGLVIAEESTGPITKVDEQKGMQFDKGWAAPEFMTNPDRGEATIENAYILLCDGYFNNLEKIKDLLNDVAEQKKKLVIIAPNFSLRVAGVMLDNRDKGKLTSLLIEAPGMGDNQKNIMQDIAILTQGKYFSEATGLRLEDATLEDLGHAEYVKSKRNETIVSGGRGTEEEVNFRIAEIKKQIEEEDVEYDREKLKERLARLTSGVAVIKVGGATEMEMKERLERVKDSLAATKAAVKKGIVPGGEVVYLVARERVKSLYTKGKYIFGKSAGLTKDDIEKIDNAGPNEDVLVEGNIEGAATDYIPPALTESEQVAFNILYKALYEPFKILLTNAAMNDGEWYEKLKSAKKNFGINVVKQELCDMVAEGIIDPALVPIEALRNAVSTAIINSQTGTIIIQKDIDKK